MASQDEFRLVLQDPQLLTRWFWRRLETTVGLLANLTAPQLAALGDWGDRVSDSQAKMPSTRQVPGVLSADIASFLSARSCFLQARRQLSWRVPRPNRRPRPLSTASVQFCVEFRSGGSSLRSLPMSACGSWAAGWLIKQWWRFGCRAGPMLRDGARLCFPSTMWAACVNGDACPVAHQCAVEDLVPAPKTVQRRDHC